MKKIKLSLSVVSLLLINTFFYTQYQRTHIKQVTTKVDKLSESTRLSTNSGTINQVTDNDNHMPDYSQAKNTVNHLFEAGYASNQRVLAQVANSKVQKFLTQFLGQLANSSEQGKQWHVTDNQLQFSQQKDVLLFFGALTATNGSRTVNYQLSGQLNVKGNEVTSLTLGNLTRGDQ
ncbi:hypothetical protein [Leuconostoc citreum]|uniref:hypothetical protein n=1 Tax=Leuconostoc citreum TaxID=33964 RepID=UPI001FB8A1F5|nr:hypothetical protein [Leuconostoc citreum]MCJ2168039.1 hypothetical protein [Leuconostoc citreum]